MILGKSFEYYLAQDLFKDLDDEKLYFTAEASYKDKLTGVLETRNLVALSDFWLKFVNDSLWLFGTPKTSDIYFNSTYGYI